MSRKKIFLFLCGIFATISFAGCTAYKAPNTPFNAEVAPVAPDYTSLDFWISHPEKYDSADCVPGRSYCTDQKNAPADVFFIYPTIYNSKDNWNANVRDSALNARIQRWAIRHQASIFNESCRIYAPIYRQGTYGAYFVEDKKSQYQTFTLAYQDVKNAFEHYLEHENQGRPIVIAGHSQGSMHGIRLLRDYFDGKPLSKQLVAAYIPGWPVPADTFSTLKPCDCADATGCYNTWNTWKWGHTPKRERKHWFDNAVVVNPVNWTSDSTYAPYEEHKGAVMHSYDEIYPNALDAQESHGMLWVHKPYVPKRFWFVQNNYHIADYNFFWQDIRENVGKRVGAFLEANDKQEANGTDSGK